MVENQDRPGFPGSKGVGRYCIAAYLLADSGDECQGKICRQAGYNWNIAGLLILLNIVTIAILSMPTPIRVFMNEPANTIVSYFPIIWLPGILVPIAYSMHFFSLRQLLSGWNRQTVENGQTLI